MTGLPDENWSGSIQPPTWSPPANDSVVFDTLQEIDPRTFWLHVQRHPILFPLLKYPVVVIGTILQGAVMTLGLTLPWGYFDKSYLNVVSGFGVVMLFMWAMRDNVLASALMPGFDNPSHAAYLMLRRAVRCGIALTAGYFAHAEAVRRGLIDWHPFAVWAGATLLVYFIVSPLFHAAARGPLRWLFPLRKTLARPRPSLWRDPAELRSPPV